MTNAYIYSPGMVASTVQQATATFQEGAIFQSGITVEGQAYGAQRVPSSFNVSATGIATAPSQFFIPFVGGQNIAYDATIYLTPQGAGGAKVSITAPSGCAINATAQGMISNPTGFAGDVINISNGGSGVGTGIYGQVIGQQVSISVYGTAVGSVGVVGPVMLAVEPVTNGHTMTYLANSNLIVFPST